MRRDFISQVQATCFYVNLVAKQYGVCINVKDIEKKDEVMNYFYNDEMNKKSIKAWEQEWAGGAN